jgi:acetyltransferase-like isoleucine patch superfamily enzyme
MVGDGFRELHSEPVRRAQLLARAMRPLRRRQFASFGHDAIVDRPIWLYGAHHMTVGDSSMILRNAWLAVEKEAWRRPAPVLRIGFNVAIRPFCTISAAESITIEDHVVFGAMVTVIDSNHTWDGGHPSVLYNPIDTAPVRIGEGTWVADRAAILAGADIGRQCIIGANSVVRDTIPDYSVAVGSPARVVGTTKRD